LLHQKRGWHGGIRFQLGIHTVQLAQIEPALNGIS
jgi:hypothetical protein